MEIRRSGRSAGDRLGGCGPALRAVDDVDGLPASAASRTFQAGCVCNGEFIQDHPTAIRGGQAAADERIGRGEGGGYGCRAGRRTLVAASIPQNDALFPRGAYRNRQPRAAYIATREIFNVCPRGLSGEKDRLCVYLDVTHIRTRPSGSRGHFGDLRNSRGDPRTTPMKIFPAVNVTRWAGCGALRTDGRRGLRIGFAAEPAYEHPGYLRIGECDYHYHGANRLGPIRLWPAYLRPVTAPGVTSRLDSLNGGPASSRLRRSSTRRYPTPGPLPVALDRPPTARTRTDCTRNGAHHDRAATVVRHNDSLERAYEQVGGAPAAGEECSLPRRNWTNRTSSSRAR
jgi:succinate dehydrogenase / fumarate reductase flavoprotein subunit